jgi:predicted secreted protein
VTTFDESSDGHEISLTNGDEFEIQLAENPTTGFRWRVVSDGAPALALLNDEFHAPSNARPGQPGTHGWRFRCNSAGQCEIKFVNARGQTAGREFALRVRASG